MRRPRKNPLTIFAAAFAVFSRARRSNHLYFLLFFYYFQ
jgi:hypothetical protein